MPSFEHLHLSHLHSDLYLMNHPKQLRTYFHINFQDAWKLLFCLRIDGRASQLGEQKNSFFLGASFASLQSLEWSQSTWDMEIAPWLCLGHQGPALASQDSTSPYLWIKKSPFIEKRLITWCYLSCRLSFRAELDPRILGNQAIFKEDNASPALSPPCQPRVETPGVPGGLIREMSL